LYVFSSALIYFLIVLYKTVKNCVDQFVLAWIFSCLVYFGWV